MKIIVSIRTTALTISTAEVEGPSTIAAVMQALQPGSVAARHLGDLPFGSLVITAAPAAGKASTLNQEACGVVGS